MRALRFYSRFAAHLAAMMAASSALANPLVTAVTQNGTIVNTQLPLVTSASSPGPTSPPAPAESVSGAFVDETYAFVTRTAEFTIARTDPATGLLATAATGNPVVFPSYLSGKEYIQFPNEHRNVADYSTNITFSAPVTAYLLIDNRAGQNTGAKANTTDPDLTTVLSWVTTDGWARVNTGIMPLSATGAPQADYIGIDEGATVASADLRIHTSSGLVAGSGQGLNNFYAIYTKNFPAGPNTGVTKATGQNTNINFYGLVVAQQVPEPSTLALGLVGLGGSGWFVRRRCAR